jgi:hypothetical protein
VRYHAFNLLILAGDYRYATDLKSIWWQRFIEENIHRFFHSWKVSWGDVMKNTGMVVCEREGSDALAMVFMAQTGLFPNPIVRKIPEITKTTMQA